MILCIEERPLFENDPVMCVGQNVLMAVESQKLGVTGVKDVHDVLLMQRDLRQDPELHVDPTLVQR